MALLSTSTKGKAGIGAARTAIKTSSVTVIRRAGGQSGSKTRHHGGQAADQVADEAEGRAVE